MDERIETQRLKLLRLLAGWLAVVSVLSTAPIAPTWTRRIRGFVFSVLRRAEVAAQCLVLTQACLIARSRGEVVDAAVFSRPAYDPLLACASDGDEPPSLAELWSRIVALRCLLKHLPRRGLRLLKTLKKRGAGPSHRVRILAVGDGLFERQRRIERDKIPPDI